MAKIPLTGHYNMATILKNILARIAAVWALLVFVTTMLITLIPVSIAGFWSEPKRSVITHHFYSAWMSVFFFLVGVRRIIKGKENFKRGENYVIVCNHNSFMDVTFASGSI